MSRTFTILLFTGVDNQISGALVLKLLVRLYLISNSGKKPEILSYALGLQSVNIAASLAVLGITSKRFMSTQASPEFSIVRPQKTHLLPCLRNAELCCTTFTTKCIQKKTGLKNCN